MTDGSFALSDVPGTGADRPAEQRGELHVAEAAVVSIVEGAARSSPGAVVHTGVLQRLGGTAYPRARVDERGGRLWIRLDIADYWPGTTTAAAREAAARVRAETARITGMVVVAVDVTVHLLDEPDRTERSLA